MAVKKIKHHITTTTITTIIKSPHASHITTSPHHHITTSHIITSPPHHITTIIKSKHVILNSWVQIAL